MVGQLVDRSCSEGRGVYECWIYLFQLNAENWKLKNYKEIKTDKELDAQMKAWFPKRRSMASAVRMRNVFNNRNGSVVFHRYLREKRRVCIATARGLPISKWRLE